jgi:hypothetical protein
MADPAAPAGDSAADRVDDGAGDRKRERDRDQAGRARNARPRDGLGRPLARGAVGQPVLPDPVAVTPGWALETAQRLLDEGRPFHAHEVLEAAWKSADSGERDLWQGLAQLAVGLTHALRGNARGAAALLRRGSGRIAAYAGTSPHGIDVDGLIQQGAEIASQIEDRGLAALGPVSLTLTNQTEEPDRGPRRSNQIRALALTDPAAADPGSPNSGSPG